MDRSYHHAAMKKLGQSEKRGRPDIMPFALVEALGWPLNKERRLKAYVRTTSDCVIAVKPASRLPRNYKRFVCLVEKLVEFEKIPPQSTEKALLTIKHQTMPQLISEVKPSHFLAFS